MNHLNSVLALRLQELQRTTKPFNARGSRVVRCDHCLLPQADCICFAKPEPCAKSAFLFLMYTGECFKPTNTGRLIADVAMDNHAFVWDRTEPAPALLALLADPQYQPVVIFPTQYAEPERCINRPKPTEGKKTLFILLDGTWREAKKMFSKSPYLNQFPVLGIQPTQASNYQLREAAHLHQLCTAEVMIEVLKVDGDERAAQQLSDYFHTFRKHYMAGKPHLNFQQKA
ncbi:tRNA-uridine aminocarboxypropyltransferase [Rheinheimera sp.]|uniref:tRNA-uridine aminocarboxypropyltransferase n=1 Tax=Rheinheimera sp. TaxID=1869214 RepID=UPI0027BA1AD8|nr:DTW domain-containing protein [Rheinheimera sp.]